MDKTKVNRVLIYRLGSIGDTIVALPCFHLIRNSFPESQILLLTNNPVEKRAAPAMSILDGTGLVDDYLFYPVGTRGLANLYRIVRSIREFAPDILVYLVSRRRLSEVIRDYLFVAIVGVAKTIGFPFTQDRRNNRPPAMGGDLWESEACRLARGLAGLGEAHPDQMENWSLGLSAFERAQANFLLGGPTGFKGRLIGLSLGTKQDIKNWGAENWRYVIKNLADPDFGLVLIGASEDSALSDEIVQDWPGPVYNCCGKATPRVSAALAERLEFLLCHDSGPMHLAAAVGTRCIAVFASLRPPGIWFPCGSDHVILTPPPGETSITAIKPDQVLAAARDAIAAGRLACP